MSIEVEFPESLIEGPKTHMASLSLKKVDDDDVKSSDERDEEEARNAEAIRRAKLFPNTIQKQKCCPQILVVDDYEFNIHALTLMLKSYKLKCDCAVNGR